MIGTAANAVGIVAGGVFGLASKRQLSARRQENLRIVLGAFTVFFGLRALWIGMGDFGRHRLWAFGLVLLALMLGKLTGHLAGIQRRLNGLGRYARHKYESAEKSEQRRFASGFVLGTTLFCLAPLATIGALQEGLTADFRVLVVKAIMDGFVTMAFVRTFGWSVVAAVLPVVVYQGTLTLVLRILAPELESRFLIGPIYATCGFMVFAVSLVMLKLRNVEIVDYYPALLYAPCLAWIAG